MKLYLKIYVHSQETTQKRFWEQDWYSFHGLSSP